jgi:hypothetical protein
MSYYVLNINDEIDFNNIILGKEVKISDNISKIYLYWLDNKPKDLYIKMPPSRLIYNFKNLKFNQIKIPIYPLYSLNENLINFFKKLEKMIQQKIKINKPYSSVLEKKDKITTLKVNIPTDVKIKSKVPNMTIETLKINCELEGVISIPWIWIKDDSWGLSLYGYQFKYTPKIDELDISFYDEEPIKPKQNQIPVQPVQAHIPASVQPAQIHVQSKEPSQSIPTQNSEQKKPVQQPMQTKPMFALSASLLSDTLNKMKERNKNKEQDQETKQ